MEKKLTLGKEIEDLITGLTNTSFECGNHRDEESSEAYTDVLSRYDTAKEELRAAILAFNPMTSAAESILSEVTRKIDYPESNDFKILQDVATERERQDEMFGGAETDAAKGPNHFVRLIKDYAGWARVKMSLGDAVQARERFVQVAALAVVACSLIDQAAARSEGRIVKTHTHSAPNSEQTGTPK